VSVSDQIDFSDLANVPIPVPKLIASDGYITGIDWNWMTKRGNDWSH
jgi:hypothetical protein